MPIAQHPQYPKWSTLKTQLTKEDNDAEPTRLIKLANEDGPAALPRPGKQRFSGQMHFRRKLGKEFGDFVQALKSNKGREKKRKP